MTSTVMFVGGPRHGKWVEADITEERERYRVPALSKKDEPVEYVSTKVILTFPNPVTGEATGETWHAWLYVLPDMYPDNPAASQVLPQAMADAAMRFYMYGNGGRTTGGPDAVKASAEPVYIAWCDECPGQPEESMHEFVDMKTRAQWMVAHRTATGHTAQWENRKG